MKVLQLIDKWFEKIIMAVSGVLLFGIVVYVFITPLSRYVFNFSLAGTGDLPPYMMIFLVFLASIAGVRNKNLIRIDVIPLIIKSKKALHWLYTVMEVLMAAAMLYFFYHSLLYVMDTYSYGNREPAMNIPYWFLYSVITFNAACMAIYYFVNFIKDVIAGVKPCQS